MDRRDGRTRRLRFLAAISLLGVLSLLAACTAGADPTPSQSSSPSEKSSSRRPVTLRLSVYGGPQEIAAYQAMVDAFTDENPRVKVRIETAPDRTTAEGRLRRAFYGTDVPDVFLAGSDMLPVLAGEDKVQPVDELLGERGIEFGDNYERLGLEAFAAESSLQCMPSDVSPLVVFYNQRLLLPSALVTPGQQVPTPETGWRWEQFAAAAEAMSHDGVKGVYLEPSLKMLTPFVRGSGSDIVDDPDEPTTLTLSDDGARRALETILALARNPQLNLTPAELATRDAVARFERGQLGMLIGTRELVPRLRAARGLRFDVFPLPSLGRFRTVADVTGYCISSGTRHLDAAADLVAFASSDEGARLTASAGSITAANREAATATVRVQRNRFPRNSEVFTEVIRRATLMPNPPAWDDVVSQIQPGLNRLLYAPVVDLDLLLPRIDALAAAMLAGPTPSASPET